MNRSGQCAAYIYDVIAVYDAWDIANDHHSEGVDKPFAR